MKSDNLRLRDERFDDIEANRRRRNAVARAATFPIRGEDPFDAAAHLGRSFLKPGYRGTVYADDKRPADFPGAKQLGVRRRSMVSSVDANKKNWDSKRIRIVRRTDREKQLDVAGNAALGAAPGAALTAAGLATMRLHRKEPLSRGVLVQDIAEVGQRVRPGSKPVKYAVKGASKLSKYPGRAAAIGAGLGVAGGLLGGLRRPDTHRLTIDDR